MTFKSFLAEHILSIGLNTKDSDLREKHREELHNLMHTAYLGVEHGYSGLGHGTPEESQAIHDDISNSAIKAVRRNGKITSAIFYKKRFGRKSIAAGTDGTDSGKKDLKMMMGQDISQQRAWGEVSGKPEHIQRKLGSPVVPNTEAGRLLGKDVDLDADTEHYERMFGGGTKKRKVIMGFPKENQ